MPALYALSAFVMTLAGGAFAFRYRRFLLYIMAFSAGLLIVMLFQMVPLARDMYQLGDVTADLSIPKIYYWIPVLLGITGSAVATVIFIVRWRIRP